SSVMMFLNMLISCAQVVKSPLVSAVWAALQGAFAWAINWAAGPVAGPPEGVVGVAVPRSEARALSSVSSIATFWPVATITFLSWGFATLVASRYTGSM